MKKALSSGKRELLLFLERILVVIMVVSMTMVFMNSFINIATSYGTTYHYFVSPMDKNKTYEESEVFYNLLQGNMAEITRFAVIRNQLETNGKYDTKKPVDVTEYVNRTSPLAGNGVTAKYYLDDLVKWGNYGFTYKTIVGTWDELNQLFANNTATYLGNNFLGLKEYEGTVEENAKELGLEPSADDKYAMEVLIPRYKTIDGKDLMQCASNVEEYEQLKANVVEAAESLFSNYTEYSQMAELYGKAQTNIQYCFQIPGANGMQYYTNSDLSFAGKSVDKITSEIKALGGKFIYFNPDKVQISTNTRLRAADLRTILKKYEYTFQDNTRVWFWVDKDYTAEDDLLLGKQALEDRMPNYWQILGVCLCAWFIVIGIMVFLTFREGRKVTEGKIAYGIQRTDSFPLEVWFVMAAASEYVLVMLLYQLLYAYENGTIFYTGLPVAFGAIIFIANEIFIRFYFSVVRRIKAGKVWETTLLRRLLIRGKEFALKTYENGGLVSRTWIPYLIFLMVNLILVLLGVGGIVGAFLLDMLVGVYLYRERRDRMRIVESIETIRSGEVGHRIDTEHLVGENLELANSVNTIGAGIRKAVETSMKDEKMKADLITNVSHDIKTPLTSIITYVDLMKRENISDPKIAGYLEVLDAKSQRLKQLTDDLVEASKISSGSFSLQIEKINFVELARQAMGEFCESFEEKQLQVVTKLPEAPMFIEADSGQLWRVMENLFQNISKYAMNGTRVYVEMEEQTVGKEKQVLFSAKNISAQALELHPDDLTERFIRGDESRRTEGSGLGLSIAKNLIEAQGGEFEICLDGDLFKVVLQFPMVEE